MKPIKFTKVTKKYINNKIKDLDLNKETSKNLYKVTMESLRNKRLFLKDMRAINYFLGKNHIEIAFYSQDRYFTKYLE